MNVFVLCTGRTGSVSLYKVCHHIKNFTVSHESRKSLDFKYNNSHIEIDNRLCWFLGRLDKQYGDNAIYVHLRRNSDKVAESFSQRFYYKRGISLAYKYNLLRTEQISDKSDIEICRDLVKTCEENILLFLRNKTKVIKIDVENFKEGVTQFWNYINAEGDLNKALKELEVKQNKSSKSFFKKIKNQLYK
tara:strand:+ start:332 stop:901 length:570 start_codon:yes stop_codon:yes gene_type:complete